MLTAVVLGQGETSKLEWWPAQVPFIQETGPRMSLWYHHGGLPQTLSVGQLVPGESPFYPPAPIAHAIAHHWLEQGTSRRAQAESKTEDLPAMSGGLSQCRSG